MYRSLRTGNIHLVMHRMPGVQLDQLWSTLEDSEKSVICATVKEIIISIRSIPAPPIYGGIDQGQFNHHLFYSPEGDIEIRGPFDSEGQFNAALVKQLQQSWERMKQHSFKAAFYERNLGRGLVGHKPVFSHSDVQRKNVVVHRDSSQGLTISLIDWEEAGWFPSYWEYFTTLL